jgi:uncharacterized iron-regulated membrane protein
LTVKWEAGPARVWLDVHKLVGIVTGVFLVVIAATGAALALPGVVTDPLLAALTGQSPTRSAPTSSRHAGPPASLDDMVHRAQATFPAGRITRLMMPAKPQGAVTIGTLLRADNALESNLATRINAWFYPLHTGFYGGAATRLLNVLFGLSLALVSLSGGWMWVRNRLARKRAEARKRGRAQVTGAAH